jgi:hypothetical protein
MDLNGSFYPLCAFAQEVGLVANGQKKGHVDGNDEEVLVSRAVGSGEE